MRVHDQCFRQSLAFGCARSNSIVRVCLRSVKFSRVCAQWCIVLVSIGFLIKYVITHSAVLGQIPLHRACLSALGQILSCSRAMLHRFVEYWIPQLKHERAVTCYPDLENLRRGQNLLIPHENLKRTKRFNSWSFGSTPWWLKRTPSEWLHNPCIGELGAPPQYRTQDSIVDVNI